MTITMPPFCFLYLVFTVEPVYNGHHEVTYLLLVTSPITTARGQNCLSVCTFQPVLVHPSRTATFVVTHCRQVPPTSKSTPTPVIRAPQVTALPPNYLEKKAVYLPFSLAGLTPSTNPLHYQYHSPSTYHYQLQVNKTLIFIQPCQHRSHCLATHNSSNILPAPPQVNQTP